MLVEDELLDIPLTTMAVVRSVPSDLIPNLIMLLEITAVADEKSRAVKVTAVFAAVTSKLWMKFLEILLTAEEVPL